jgi:hypothetical protein
MLQASKSGKRRTLLSSFQELVQVHILPSDGHALPSDGDASDVEWTVDELEPLSSLPSIEAAIAYGKPVICRAWTPIKAKQEPEARSRRRSFAHWMSPSIADSSFADWERMNTSQGFNCFLVSWCVA